MKTLKGRVRGGALAVVLALTAAAISYSAYRAEADENRALAEEVSRLEERSAQLNYMLYEKDSREPLSGKQLVVSLIGQAIEIEGLDWDEEEVEAMTRICWRESRYDPNGQNPASTAYGLYQFLDSTWEYYGGEKTSDPLLQTIAAVRYIEDRYDTPSEALEFHLTAHVVNGRRVNYY